MNLGPTERVLKLFSENGGKTYTGLALGSLIDRSKVDQILGGVRQLAGLDETQNTRTFGATGRDGANKVFGAVGIDFKPALDPMQSLAFAAGFAESAGAVAIEQRVMGAEPGKEVIGSVPILAPPMNT